MYRRHVEYLTNLMVLMLICDCHRGPTMAQKVRMLNSRGLQSEGCSLRVAVSNRVQVRGLQSEGCSNGVAVTGLQSQGSNERVPMRGFTL